MPVISPSLDDITAELTDERTQLQARIDRLAADRDISNFQMSDQGDRSHFAIERDQSGGLLTAAKDRLADVDRALARIDAGTYGVCTSCATTIPLERLEFRPTLDQCVHCAQKAAA